MVRSGRALAVPVSTWTENISRTGVLMRWADDRPLPSIGQNLTIDIDLPDNSEFGPRLMRCNSTVVRILPEGNAVGLEVRKMSFIRSGASRGVRVADLTKMRVASEMVI